MSIKTICKNAGTGIARAAGKAKLKLKADSPKIMVIGGTISLFVAGVIACKKTAKELDAVLDQHNDIVSKLHDIKEAHNEGVEVTLPNGKDYTDDDYKQQLAFTYIRTGGRLIKVYALPLTLALLSVASILGGYKIIEGRHLAAVAEAYGLRETFKKYRERVADRFGKDVEQEIFVNGEKKLVTEEEIDPETGEVRQVTKDKVVAKRRNPEEIDVYTYIFDSANCPYSWDRHPGYNYQYLIQVQNQSNEYLQRHGCITLYEILKQLGFQDIPAETMSLGWMLDNPTGYGDGYVDFGICPIENDYDDPGCFKGGLPDYLLNFNCDGDIQASLKLVQERKRQEKAKQKKSKVHVVKK